MTEDLMARRDRIKGIIEPLVEAGIHLYDAARKAGISRALAIANVGSDPDFRRWMEMSKELPLVSCTQEQALASVEDVRLGSIQGMTDAGLDAKLEQLVALSDPETSEGAKIILQLANHRAKLMPSQQQVQRQDVREMKDPVEIKAKLAKVRAAREAREAQIKKATDANFEMLTDDE